MLKSALIFAFGPEEAVFVQCPGWLSRDKAPHLWAQALPNDLRSLATSHECAAMVFGNHASWVCIYHDSDKRWTLRLSNSCDGLPDELVAWLREIEADSDPSLLARVKISLGPEGMFFASADRSYCYGAWPNHLEKLLRKHLEGRGGKSFPEIVQIGAQKRVVIIGEKGDDTTAFASLNRFIKEMKASANTPADIKKITYLYLDPFNVDQYVLVTKSADGSLGLFCEHQSIDTADESALRSNLVAKMETEEEIQLAEDLILTPSQIMEGFAGFAQEVKERDAVIAEYESMIESYDKALDNFKAAMKDKDETIVKYERLIEQLRAQQQSDAFEAAKAIRDANDQANRDFIVRQRAQNLQYQMQMVTTALQNMNTQRNVAMQNISTMFANSLANTGNF